MDETRTGSSRGGPAVAAAVIAAIVVVVLVAVLSAQRFAEQRVRDDVRSQLEQSSSLAAIAAAENIDRMAVVATAIARLPEVQSSISAGDPAALAAIAERLQRATDGARLGAVIAPDSTVRAIFPADRSVVGQRFEERDWYVGVQEQSPYVSNAYEIAAYDNPRAVSIAVEVPGNGDDVLGYLLVAVETAYFGRSLDRVAANPGSPAVSLVDQAGGVVAASEGAGDDGARVRRASDVRGTDWRLEASLPEREAYADVRSVRIAAAAFIAVVSLLLLVLAWLLYANARRLEGARLVAARQAQAFELNDTIVQRLAVSHLALSLDRREEALRSLEEALAAGRRIIGDLAEGRDSYVRSEPASRPSDGHDEA